MKKTVYIGIISMVLMLASAQAMDQADLKKIILKHKDHLDKAAVYVINNGLENSRQKMLEDKNQGLTTGTFIIDGNYLFMVNDKGDEFLHPKLYGKNTFKVKDVDKFPMVQGFIKMANKYGSGWVQYKWWKTDKNKKRTIAAKTSYVKSIKVNGETYTIGVGIFDITKEDINQLFPEEKDKKITL